MIRSILLLWLGPVTFFWTWYFLSLNDISLGTPFLTREMHDQMFRIYSVMLGGMEPALIPPLIAKTLAFDSLFVIGLILFRKRREILAFWRRRKGTGVQPPAAFSPESLSSAP